MTVIFSDFKYKHVLLLIVMLTLPCVFFLSWEPIVKYVNEQYEKYLKEELNVNRKRRIPDTRVHCCVYFLPATGHWCVSTSCTYHVVHA